LEREQREQPLRARRQRHRLTEPTLFVGARGLGISTTIYSETFRRYARATGVTRRKRITAHTLASLRLRAPSRRRKHLQHRELRQDAEACCHWIVGGKLLGRIDLGASDAVAVGAPLQAWMPRPAPALRRLSPRLDVRLTSSGLYWRSTSRDSGRVALTVTMAPRRVRGVLDMVPTRRVSSARRHIGVTGSSRAKW